MYFVQNSQRVLDFRELSSILSEIKFVCTSAKETAQIDKKNGN